MKSFKIFGPGQKLKNLEPPEMKLLLLAPQPFYEDRGTPIAIRNVIDALIAIGYRVDLVTFAIGEEIAIENLTIFRTAKIPGIDSVPIGFSFRKAAYDLLLFCSMWGLIKKNNYDFIYAVEEASFIALAAKKMTGLPIIYDMQSYLSEQLIANYSFFKIKFIWQTLQHIENKLIREVDTIICSAGLKSIVYSINPDANVFEWLYPGLNSSSPNSEILRLRQELSISEHEKVIMYTGNAKSYQGLDLLLNSAPAVIDKHPESVFLLVGVEQHEILPVIHENVRHLIANGTIRCLGRKPRTAIPAYLSLAQVAVSPRKDFGNLPLKVFDYMWQGIPMVVTDIPAHHQVLNQETAEIVGQSSNCIANGINQLLSNPDYAGNMASKASEYAKEMLSRDAFISRIKGILNSTL